MHGTNVHFSEVSACLESTALIQLGSLDSWHFFVNRQDVGFWPEGSDRVRVDLSVTLCIVILDVREFCGTAESIIIPVAVPYPSSWR